ncbi:MAG: PAS domain S-box protein, partial [Nitrospiraceae bacterium]|nr:PAS domain S-box protein [Nitrospiraceae bacterium]
GAGNVESLIFSLKDVTERRRAEEKNRRLAAIVQSSDDGIIGKTLDGTILSWNKGAERIYGYTEEEVKGRPISILVPDDHMHDLSDILDKVSRGESVERLETVRARKDGSRVYVSLTVSPVRDAAGKIVGASTIARDVTERKKLEDQLRHAQKMEAVGTLASGIAHDFNNILSAVIGYADLLLLKMAEGDPMRRDAEEILAAADRATQLARSLLAFSRKQEMHPRRVDLNGLICGVEKFLGRVIGEDIELKTALSEEPLDVKADSGHMEQVLMNIAVNARDAMPDGGRLAIETRRIDLDEDFVKLHGYGSPGPYALLSLTDSGSGMDEETAKRIFEPFFTTKEPGKGTGLGLAIAYGIIKQHGGCINVYSEPGEGTTFRIYLPLVSSAEEAEAGTTIAPPPRSLGAETILVAEDDGAVRKLVGTVLSQFGYNVIDAEDGEEAISKFRENSEAVRLVILDMIMPKKNGKEAFEEIRKIRPGIKVLFASGYTEERARSEALAGEGCDFIVKPAAPRELLTKIRALLDR